MSNLLAWTSKPRQINSDHLGGTFYNAETEEMPKENKRCGFDLSSTLFREFATECMELADALPPRDRAVLLEMSGVWQQMAQRWDEKGLAGTEVGGEFAHTQ